MKNYLWIYLLGGVAAISLVIFLISLSKDVFYIKRLKKKKINLALNFSLLIISLSSISLIIYLFSLLREQINLIG